MSRLTHSYQLPMPGKVATSSEDLAMKNKGRSMVRDRRGTARKVPAPEDLPTSLALL